MIDVLRKERRVSVREVGGDVLPERVAPAGSRPDGVHDVDAEAAIGARCASGPAARSGQCVELRDESVKEVSERLGMSVSSVKVTVTGAIARCVVCWETGMKTDELIAHLASRARLCSRCRHRQSAPWRGPQRRWPARPPASSSSARAPTSASPHVNRRSCGRSLPRL